MAVRVGLALILACSCLSVVCSIYFTAYNYDAKASVHHTKLESIGSNKTIGADHQKEIESKHRKQQTAAEVNRRFQRRLQHLTEACRKHKYSPLFRPLPKSPRIVSVGAFWPVMNVSAEYCAIEKTGSDTWFDHFRFIHAKMADLGMNETRNASDVKRVRFLFVRDPYHRLLSAYVDKILSPNTIFWVLGRYIVRRYRSHPSNISLTCGHDVTFPEYIQYIIHSQETGFFRDGHFTPTHDHCSLCNVSYDYIGHLETVNEDMPYILDLIQSPVNYTVNFDTHTLFDNTEWVLNRMTPKIRTCMSMKEACVRLWKKWHIRGIISKREPLPVTAQQAEDISSGDFFSLALKAWKRSALTKAERRLQKEEALREAFSSVPLEHRKKLRKLLFLDFELFGFNPSPDTIFPNRSVERSDGSNNYSYFDLSV